MADVKYSLLEIDGEELVGNHEREPLAEDVKIDNTNATTVGTKIQDLIDRLFEEAESTKPTYLSNGEIDTVTFYTSATQVDANRSMKIQMNYDSDLNPTSEVLTIYDLTDGTTVLKTVTRTFTWSDCDLTKAITAVS